MSKRKRTTQEVDDSDSDSESDVVFFPAQENTASQKKQQEDEDIIKEIFEAEMDEEEGEGDDLFGDNMEDDYVINPEEDQYDPTMLDERDYAPMDFDQRLEAEREMAKRDHRLNRLEHKNEGLARLPAALRDGEDSDEDDEAFIQAVETRNRGRPDNEEENADILAFDNDQAEINLEDVVGPLREWLIMDQVRREIARRFQNFLLSYTIKDTLAYRSRITTMVTQNKQSLQIEYTHLSDAEPMLAVHLIDAPKEMLNVFDETIQSVVRRLYPAYHRIVQYIYARISGLPHLDSLRDFRYGLLNKLVKTRGVVTRRTSIFPQLAVIKFNCAKCGAIQGPFYHESNSQNNIQVSRCVNPECNSRGPFPINTEQTIYRNFQKMTLQETPGSVPAGRLPRTKEVILLGDLIDHAKPGEEIEVTGIYKNNYDIAVNAKNGFPVFSTLIEANFVTNKENELASWNITAEEEREILDLAKDENIVERIIQSIAPSICGHEDIKTALALALFGGEAKNIQNKHRIRGDINVLLLGDPGTAKSQFLKYVEKTAHRCVYTTGQGASAVGLTASVRKDPTTREWTLEGGALVLADRGICLIDEFDKMNDKDRTSIHEAMEQQTISISKAGIVTTLRARCSVIAAANPVKGRYDSSLTFAKNVELTEPILSRFDILCVVRDQVDHVTDGFLAEFVVKSHIRSHPDNEEASKKLEQSNKQEIPQELLRKYIMYARTKVRPRFVNVDVKKISTLYAEMRSESRGTGGMPLTVRHVEAIVRMAEARARMCLREKVRTDDVNMAIKVALESFINSQKFSVSSNLNKKFAQFLKYNQSSDVLLLTELQKMVSEGLHYLRLKHQVSAPETLEISAKDFELRARELEVFDLTPFYKCNVFQKNGFDYLSQRGVIMKTF